MPYRSQVQQELMLPLDTELGDELLVDRDVSDGTSESTSLSKYESSDSEKDVVDDAGDMVAREKRDDS